MAVSFKTLRNVSLLLLVVAFVIAGWGYQTIYGVNTVNTDKEELFIPSGATMPSLVAALRDEKIIKSTFSFHRVAGWMKFQTPKAGRYLIPPQLSNRDLISMLRSGRQTPIKAAIHSARTLEDAAGIIGRYLESDSSAFLSVMQDPAYLDSKGLNQYSALTAIVPNTYELYWDTSPQDFVKRMDQESKKFWSHKERAESLKKLDMTPAEVMTLASIVEKESLQKSERPRIAGVYLNRLRQGMKLQADPTVVYGVGDFNIRRVLLRHLQHDSPYNTYMYEGLPPGPICMPSIASIDAVLGAEQHDYLFFCAKPGYNGSHAFAKSNAEHQRNARVYHRWLSQQGIKG